MKRLTFFLNSSMAEITPLHSVWLWTSTPFTLCTCHCLSVCVLPCSSLYNSSSAHTVYTSSSLTSANSPSQPWHLPLFTGSALHLSSQISEEILLHFPGRFAAHKPPISPLSSFSADDLANILLRK